MDYDYTGPFDYTLPDTLIGGTLVFRIKAVDVFGSNVYSSQYTFTYSGCGIPQEPISG